MQSVNLPGNGGIPDSEEKFKEFLKFVQQGCELDGVDSCIIMAKIYAAPPTIKEPDFNSDSYQKDTESYIQEIKDFCKTRNPTGEYVGEEIHFQVADGHAVYVVASLKPVELVHAQFGDGWEFQYAKNLTKNDVIAQIKRLAGLKKLFGG
jgi:hypothetical protein